MSQQLIKRLKSLLWRAGAVAVVAVINFIAENLGAMGLSPEMVTIIGLVLGEITKFINNFVSKKV